MNFKEFNPQNVGQQKRTEPRITITKAGAFRINSEAMKFKDMEAAKSFKVVVDDEGQYYLEPCLDSTGFTSRKAEMHLEHNRSRTFHCAKLAGEIQKDYGFTMHNSVSLMLSKAAKRHSGRIFYPIINSAQ